MQQCEGVAELKNSPHIHSCCFLIRGSMQSRNRMGDIGEPFGRSHRIGVPVACMSSNMRPARRTVMKEPTRVVKAVGQLCSLSRSRSLFLSMQSKAPLTCLGVKAVREYLMFAAKETASSSRSSAAEVGWRRGKPRLFRLYRWT